MTQRMSFLAPSQPRNDLSLGGQNANWGFASTVKQYRRLRAVMPGNACRNLCLDYPAHIFLHSSAVAYGQILRANIQCR